MTQKEMILEMLMVGERMTQLDALREAGCFRLASRINELRSEGWKIATDWIDYRTRFGESKRIASYRLIETESKEGGSE